MRIELEDKLRNLRCPNAPEGLKGPQYSTRDRHETFERRFRLTVTATYIDNGRQWGFDNPAATARDIEPQGPVVCATCGAETEITPWEGAVLDRRKGAS